ncbi:hypothetical protein AAB988_17900 [Burkholderia contaminans]|uniref:hypothetical protein n=1 Tax=Burkholderia contaminans TaxID=488447 RepID=UPI00310FA50C
MGLRQPFLHVCAGFGDVYKNETHFQMEDRGGAVVLIAVIAAVGAKVVGSSPRDFYLDFRKAVADAVSAAWIEDPADLDKKYTAEVNNRLVRLVVAIESRMT